jgi:2,3-diketo-5-methylthiopentyl-1-phosphate enolase
MTGREDLVATYIADLGDDATEAQTAAAAFAVGQSVGTWVPVPGITPEMQAAHAARVVEVRPLADGASVAGEPVDQRPHPDGRRRSLWLLRVAFPTVNFGAQFPMLFTTLLGNDPSTAVTVRLVDVEAPPAFLGRFGGPRLGIDGWRRLTGVQDRPLLLNMIKPCTGFPPEVGADFVEAVARGGCDLIKDDELLADATFSRVAKRARIYRRRLDQVADETGHRAWYVANVTTRARSLVDTARAAIDGGAGAVMINALAVGPDLVQELAEAGLGVPILAHMAGVDTFAGDGTMGFGRALLVRLNRLAGADAVLTDNPLGPRHPSSAVVRATVDSLREPWPPIRPALPVVGGGLTAAHLAPVVAELGIDLMFGVGGAIQGHPDGPTAGARAIRAAIDDAVRSAAVQPASGADTTGIRQPVR